MEMGSQICRKGSFIIITAQGSITLRFTPTKEKKGRDKSSKLQYPLPAAPLNGYPCSISHWQCDSWAAGGGGKKSMASYVARGKKKKKKKTNRFIIHSRESNHAGHWYISKGKNRRNQTLNQTLTKEKDSLNERKVTHTESRSNLETDFDRII